MHLKGTKDAVNTAQTKLSMGRKLSKQRTMHQLH